MRGKAGNHQKAYQREHTDVNLAHKAIEDGDDRDFECPTDHNALPNPRKMRLNDANGWLKEDQASLIQIHASFDEYSESLTA
jgi:hypothetical protein